MQMLVMLHSITFNKSQLAYQLKHLIPTSGGLMIWARFAATGP